MERFFTGPNLIFLGLMIWAAWMLRNAAKKSERSQSRDITKELQAELRAKQRSAEAQLHQLEIRLLDYDRDISARVETTLTMLDQLIAEADQEIIRLETLLEDRGGVKSSPLSPEQRRMVVHLAGAGYSIKEIANLVDRPTHDVQSALDENQANGQAA